MFLIFLQIEGFEFPLKDTIYLAQNVYSVILVKIIAYFMKHCHNPVVLESQYFKQVTNFEKQVLNLFLTEQE